MQNKIFYFGDPLCSWCYGFAPEITTVIEHYGDDFDFELVMGGLRPFGKEKMPEMAEMLKHHWEQVNERTGVPFQYGIMENESFAYDTEPPSRAVIAMKRLNPGTEFAFFKDIQRAFYYDNKDTSKEETYFDLLDGRTTKEEFKKAFHDENIKQETLEMFGYARKVGVRGFPSIVLLLNDQLYLIANGFLDSASLIKAIDLVVEENGSKKRTISDQN